MVRFNLRGLAIFVTLLAVALGIRKLTVDSIYQQFAIEQQMLFLHAEEIESYHSSEVGAIKYLLVAMTGERRQASRINEIAFSAKASSSLIARAIRDLPFARKVACKYAVIDKGVYAAFADSAIERVRLFKCTLEDSSMARFPQGMIEIELVGSQLSSGMNADRIVLLF